MSPPYCYEYPRPAVTVDLVAFAMLGDALSILLIRRKKDPFAGRWALPGGFLNLDESAAVAARRELKEETGLDLTGPVEPIGFFDKPGRDPRGRTISLAFAATVRGPVPAVSGGDDADQAAWFKLAELRPLAFDHDEILDAARQWLSARARDGPAGLAFLPAEFAEPEVKAMLQVTTGSARGVARWLGQQEKQHQIRTLGPGRFALLGA